MNRSWVVSAVMWAMPVASRTTDAFADRPGTAAVPPVCGKARAVTQTTSPVTARIAISRATSSTPTALLTTRTHSSSTVGDGSTVR
jgi:hypothetical protein